MRFPVSFSQQLLWFLDQLEPGVPTYNMPYAMWLDGPLDSRALQRVKRLFRGDGRCPCSDRVVQLIMGGVPAGDGREPLIFGEVGPTQQIFTNPNDPRTEEYVTGKFG